MTDFLLLALGHALVWAVGIVLIHLLPRQVAATPSMVAVPCADGGRAWILGAGWFVGAFVLTLLLRVESWIGVPFSLGAVGAPLLLIVVLGVALALRTPDRRSVLDRWRTTVIDVLRAAAGHGLAGVPRALWLALVAWLVARFALLLAETTMRPLYAWDTWMQWATKARVWFELKTMVPFAPFEVWLPAGGAVYFDAAPHYPATAPLWQVWSALLIGRWDDTLTNVAWWCTGVALCLALYGFVRGAGGSRLFALAGAWLASSLPILNVHIGLAGYADLPIAAYLTLAALAGWRWTRGRSVRDLALLLLFLAALPTIKNPGKAWVVFLLPGVLVGLWPRWGLRAAAVFAGAGALALLVLAQTSPVVLGYRLQFGGGFSWQSLADAYFLYANWHLLWYAAIAAAVVGARSLLTVDTAPLTVTLGIGFLFLLFGFAFTNAALWVDDQSTVNRATLHLAPLTVVWLLLVYRDWSLRVLAPPVVAAAGHPASA